MALDTTTLKTVTEWETREQTANAIPAMHRVLVTVLGRAIFGLMNVAERRGLWLVVVLVLLQFLIEVVVAWHYTLGRPFITPTALTISAAGGTDVSLAVGTSG
jgi:hypothetical protein